MSENGPKYDFLCSHALGQTVCFSQLPERIGALAGILGGKHVGTPILPAQQQFIEALLAGRNVTESALIAGVSRRTAVRWLAEGQPVAIEYDKQRLALLQQSRDRIAHLHARALSALESALSDEAPLQVRLDVAKFVLGHNPGTLSYSPPWGEDAPTLAHNEERRERDLQLESMPFGS